MAVGILMVRDLFEETSIVWIRGFRFLVATAALLLFAIATGRGRSLAMGFQLRNTWKMTIPMALPGPFLATLFWIAGFKYLTAGRAAIYNQMSTVFIILLAWLVLKEKMSLVIKLANAGGKAHVHLQPDLKKFFPTKIRVTMVQVAKGSTYEATRVPGLSAQKNE